MITKSLDSYVLPISRAPRVLVDNLYNDDLGREVLGRLNEKFRGNPRISYENLQFKEGQPITDSNTPRALAIAQILREIKPDIRVLSPQDVLELWDLIPDRGLTNADTSAVVIYPQSGPNEDLRTKVLADLGKKSIETPILVTGLGVEKANTDYGFRLVKTDHTLVTELADIQRLGKEKGVPVYAVDSGLRRVGRDRVVLDAGWCDYLVGAGGGGRVQVAQAPKERSA